MDELAERLAAINWKYADKDPAAKAELASRIAQAGRELRLITYSDLVRGVQFHLSNVRGAEPFEIDVEDWTGLDRAIVGEFLGSISEDSYREGGFLATALVVNKSELKPSDQFFIWMKELGVLPNTREDTVLLFWIEQVNLAHQWYRTH